MSQGGRGDVGELCCPCVFGRPHHDDNDDREAQEPFQRVDPLQLEEEYPVKHSVQDRD